MSEPQKRAIWPWIVVALVVALVVYPLSIGPAIWFRNQAWTPELAKSAYFELYAPIIWLYLNGPQPIAYAILWYAELWG